MLIQRPINSICCILAHILYCTAANAGNTVRKQNVLFFLPAPVVIDHCSMIAVDDTSMFHSFNPRSDVIIRGTEAAGLKKGNVSFMHCAYTEFRVEGRGEIHIMLKTQYFIPRPCEQLACIYAGNRRNAIYL